MGRERLRVVATRRLPEAVVTRMSELFDADLRENDLPMTREELAEAARRTGVLAPAIADAVDASQLEQAREWLKLTANCGAGADRIDVPAARRRGVMVAGTPGVATEDAADKAMALILAATRRIPEGLSAMQAGG